MEIEVDWYITTQWCNPIWQEMRTYIAIGLHLNQNNIDYQFLSLTQTRRSKKHLNIFYNKVGRILSFDTFLSQTRPVSAHANWCHHRIPNSGSVCRQEKNIAIYWLIIYQYPPIGVCHRHLQIWHASTGNILGELLRNGKTEGCSLLAKRMNWHLPVCENNSSVSSVGKKNGLLYIWQYGSLKRLEKLARATLCWSSREEFHNPTQDPLHHLIGENREVH